MKNLLFWISSFLVFTFWPASFIFSNTTSFLPFLIVTLIFFASWLLYVWGFKNYYFLYVLFPIIHPVYLVFPLVILVDKIRHSKKTPLIIYSALIAIVSVIAWRVAYNHSIFTPDPLAKDTLIKKISLVPDRNLARVFANKTTVHQDKFKANLFVFLDPNYYFFASHPRELGDSQNLTKYHYLGIIPFLLGLFFLPALPHRKWIITAFVASVLTLSLVNNPDRFDLILTIPISLTCFYGLKYFSTYSPRYFNIFSVIFIAYSIMELFSLIFKQ